jgi:MFS family permease
MLDSSIVATSLYTIGIEFGELASINWVALAYTLTYLGFSVLFARVSDIVGRRAAFILAFSVFIVFSVACGFAKDLETLIAMRALQGIGGSGGSPLDMFRRRNELTQVLKASIALP